MLVIDLRTVNEEKVVNSGRRLMGAQAGVLLEIEKKATTSDLLAHIFTIGDAYINIKGRHLTDQDY